MPDLDDFHVKKIRHSPMNFSDTVIGKVMCSKTHWKSQHLLHEELVQYIEAAT